MLYPALHCHNRATLCAGALKLQCVIGRSGLRLQSLKKEGDGATPIGRFQPRRVFYRADRVSRPLTSLPVRPLSPDDGWCDAVGSGAYNRLVRKPFRYSHETMWREDHVYDIVIEIDHNTRPRIQGRGSAVFMHLARPDLRPTDGCVALSRHGMLRLLALLTVDTIIDVGPAR